MIDGYGVRIVKMHEVKRHVLIGKRLHPFHPAAAAAVMRVVHGDDDICKDLISKGLCLIAGHGSEAACGYHEDIRAEKLGLLVIGEHAAKVAHVHELVPVPIEDMYLILASERAPAGVVEAVDDAHLIRAGSGCAGKVHALAVVVSPVLMAHEHRVGIYAQRRVVRIREVIRINDDAVAVVAYLKA